MTPVQPQLPLPVVDDWRLDAHTREAARRGIAEARAALDALRRVDARSAKRRSAASRAA